MKKIVVLSGAGVSAESGLKTFRDHDGMWENYNVMEVATPEAWLKDREMVLDFYNKRREQVVLAQPNYAHKKIAELEEKFDVHVITQNIDDLHERAGSSKVLHLHGMITQARSENDDNEIIDIGNKNLKIGDLSPSGSQLRPHVVWFGEPVPAMYEAERITSTADILIVIGTSLVVYPAAGLIHAVREKTEKYIIDPAPSAPGARRRPTPFGPTSSSI